MIKCHPIIYYYTTLHSLIYTQGLDDTNVNIDREVTEEEDSVEYNIEHGNGNDGTDMMLSQEQMDWINGDGSDRALVISNWPRTGSYVTIPYSKDENNPWGDFENGNIQSAVDAYAEHTCIRYLFFANLVQQQRDINDLPKTTIFQI